MPSGWVAAGAGFLFHYLNARWNDERRARIDRVNDQLKLFYGPLLAAVSATSSAYEALVAQHSPDGSRRAFQEAVGANPGGPEAEAYRLWVAAVLQPLNEQAAAIVSDHIDMLDNPRMVPELLQLVAHVSTMRVVLKRWERGDRGAASAITYPDRLLGYCEAEFNRVKLRQAKLLGEQVPKALGSKGEAGASGGGGGHAAGGSGGAVKLEVWGTAAERQRRAQQRASNGGGGGSGSGGSGEALPRSKL